MDDHYIERIDASGASVPIDASPAARRDAVLVGEALHRQFRADLADDYGAYIERMVQEGAHLLHLVDEGEVRALAVWRHYLTTYCGRRFEIDDLVTSPAHRSKGHGATLVRALEAKARTLKCDMAMLISGTHRRDAHRFYFRERYAITSFLFSKELNPGQ